MKIEEQRKFYDELWTRNRLNSLYLRRFVRILDLFVVVKKKFKSPRILDLGCGDGRLTAILGEFGEADGLELSEQTVTKNRELYPHVSFFSGNALEYSFKEKDYDVVISQEVIEHLWEQEAYLEVCYSVLRPGGYLILTTPNKRVLDCMTEGHLWSSQPIENTLSPRSLKKLVSKKFKIISYDSIILNFGDKGYFKLINSRIIIGLSNKLGLGRLRERVLGKKGMGLHQCILAIKTS